VDKSYSGGLEFEFVDNSRSSGTLGLGQKEHFAKVSHLTKKKTTLFIKGANDDET